MKVTVLCSDPRHPKWPALAAWVDSRPAGSAQLVTRIADATGGDFLFLISCAELVRATDRARYGHTLVVHASELPRGRGWSPHVWAVLEGKDRICVTLLEAADKVDSGRIWAQREIRLGGHELFDEIADRIAACELDLMDFAIANAATIEPRVQEEGEATYLRRHTPDDSALDVERSLADQFELLRVSDPERYPAFFDHRGHRYLVSIRKAETAPDEVGS